MYISILNKDFEELNQSFRRKENANPFLGICAFKIQLSSPSPVTLITAITGRLSSNSGRVMIIINSIINGNATANNTFSNFNKYSSIIINTLYYLSFLLITSLTKRCFSLAIFIIISIPLALLSSSLHRKAIQALLISAIFEFLR